MNVEQKLLKYLTDKGMSENQAKEVLSDYLKNISKDTNYQITLGSDVGAYPDAVFRVLFLGLKNQAIQWIDKNIPLAWFRPMFV